MQSFRFVPREKSRGFLLWRTNGGQKQNKKGSNCSHLSKLLLFFCTPAENKKAQYRAIRCNNNVDKMLMARYLFIAMYRKKFISGGQMADTE